VRLGDGTEESHQKIHHSFDDLWMFTGDLFEMNEVDELLIKAGIAVDLNEVKKNWDSTVNEVLQRATLQRPKDDYMQTGRLQGMHSEYLGHLLTDMQYLQRAYPDATW